MAAFNYLCTWPTGQQGVNTAQECVALDPNAYIAQSAVLASQASLENIFAIPVATDLAQMWGLGFGLPVLCYLVAWGYGSVINFIGRGH